MRPVRVLIIDDSAVGRRVLSDILAASTDIEVIGTAATGQIGLSKIPTTLPDIVTLDVEMPEWDGLRTLQEIKSLYPKLPVLMCSSTTQSGASITLEALAYGAEDCIAKPSSLHTQDSQTQFREELIAKVKIIGSKSHSASPCSVATPPPKIRPSLAPAQKNEGVDILAIGSSTGGPCALTTVLSALPGNLNVPIVIAQHMPPVFTKLLADRTSELTQFPVFEGAQGQPLSPNSAWIAPGDYHMQVVRQGIGQPTLTLNQAPRIHGVRPAVDLLFESVVQIYGSRVLAVVLTGMGQDGLIGCEQVRKAGGQVIVQDEATSVVWGMPGAVAKAGLADAILPINEIANEITRRILSTAVARNSAPASFVSQR